MTNLLEETLAEMAIEHITPQDVLWVGSSSGRLAVSWPAFAEIAGGTNYDSGYGAQEIASDLVIVCTKSRWFARVEYDGSEGWSFRTAPKKQRGAEAFRHVAVRDGMVGWENLQAINRPIQEG